MERVLQPTIGAKANPASATEPGHCFHCGTPCSDTVFAKAEKLFCCQGCLTVFEILQENGLTDFYNLAEDAGVRVRTTQKKDEFLFLDHPPVRERIVNFSNAHLTRVTFRIPAIHCIACVWLLENLFRLKTGIGESVVNFPRKEVSISFENEKLKLSELVALLVSLGYEPDLKLSDLEKPREEISRRLWLQLGVAAFAFGNIMLLSISQYLGLDQLNGPRFEKLFGWISFVLALPVVFYSATDYWKAAWLSLRQRRLTIEVPIAAGIAALFGQSMFEIFTGRGEGYFDSLAGLLFFLLGGKLFQQKAYARLAFDRDFKSFFPLAVRRVNKTGLPENGETISLSQLRVGDHLLIRNGELIPADARLISGLAVIDYSFVTGESDPMEKRTGDYLYAGGRQISGVIEIETTKDVSQSYLTSLWNQDAFRKEKAATLDTITNRYSYRFTWMILGLAFLAALFWSFSDVSRGLKAFTSVLIVACPCALALAAPYALGTAQRVLAKRDVFLKNPTVVETLAEVNSVVFDKTGTLTAAGLGSVTFEGPPLDENEKRCLVSLARNSTHPCSARIVEAFPNHTPANVRSFSEKPGCGIEGIVAGHEILMGSAAWLELKGVQKCPPPDTFSAGSVVHVSLNGQHRGCFHLTSALRPNVASLLESLSQKYEVALLSGDNAKERQRFAELFGLTQSLHFNQSPLHKLEFIQKHKRPGRAVMMVGDGLNDAGALKTADVGVAVVENIGTFSPASDVIMTAFMVPRLDAVLRFSQASVRIVRLSFLISTLYNVVGLSIAVQGLLSPIVCAILMPLSSITVVAFACGATSWTGRRIFDEREKSIREISMAREKGLSLSLPVSPELRRAA